MTGLDPWPASAAPLARIPWYLGRRARDELRTLFDLPGIHVWGAGRVPLYVGKTTGSFRRRLGRFVWDARSQCNLAKDYQIQLQERGLDGFPAEIREWYRGYGGTTARLRGAVAFANYGIDRIWFALLPARDPAGVDEFEHRLLPIANQWNLKRGLPPLLNVAGLRA